MANDKPDDVVLPCGCFIACVVVGGVNEMRISPCRPDCRILALALEEASEQSKPIEYREA